MNKRLLQTLTIVLFAGVLFLAFNKMYIYSILLLGLSFAVFFIGGKKLTSSYLEGDILAILNDNNNKISKTNILELMGNKFGALKPEQVELMVSKALNILEKKDIIYFENDFVILKS